MDDEASINHDLDLPKEIGLCYMRIEAGSSWSGNESISLTLKSIRLEK